MSFQEEPKEDAGPSQLDMLPNIADFLRANVAKTTACDGIRIDRLFYDPEGVLRVEALVDHLAQPKELKPFLEGNQTPLDPKRQMSKGWNTGRLTVIPLRPMMVALREGLPSLSEFDGVKVVRAHHDPKNQLVITALAIGDADAKALTPILRRLLDSHPRWRLRTSDGLVLDIPPQERRKADPDLSKSLTMKALKLLQVTIGEARVEPGYPSRGTWWSHNWPFDDRLPRERPTDEEYDRCLEYLDAALPHNPRNVLAWYLRAYVLQAKDRRDLSMRDLRRMVAVEIEDPDLRHQRILQLELVQGKLRQSAWRMEQAAFIEVSDGWTLRELRESPIARDMTPTR